MRKPAAVVGILMLGLVFYWFLAKPSKRPTENRPAPDRTVLPIAKQDEKTAEPAGQNEGHANSEQPDGTVFGVVRDLHGTPVSRAKVSITTMMHLEWVIHKSPDSEIESDDHGQFKFDGLSQGTFFIFAEKDGRFSPQHQTVELMSEKSRVGPIDLILEETSELRLKTVDKRTGTPIAGAVVELAQSGMPNIATDEKGAAWCRLNPGIWKLNVYARGYFPKRTKVAMEEGRSFDLTLWLEESFSAVARVVDSSGRPLDGVEIMGPPRFYVEPLGEGAYFVGGLPSNSRTILNFFKRGYESVRRALDIAGGQTHGLLEVVLNAAPVEKPDSENLPEILVEGVVSDTNSKPIPGAEVELRQQKRITDKNGRFSFDPVRGNYFLIAAQADGFAKRIESRQRVHSGEMTVELVLGRAHELTGRVVDAKGKPLSKGTVRAHSIPGAMSSFWADLEPGGTFELNGLGPQVDLTVDAKGYSTKRIENLSLPCEPLEIVMEAFYLHGKVLAEGDDRPITRFRVWSPGLDDSFENLPMEIASPDGLFRIGPFRSGLEVNLRIEAEDFVPGYFEPIPTSEEKAEPRPFYLKKTGFTVSGRVLDEAQRPMADIPIDLFGNQSRAQTLYWGIPADQVAGYRFNRTAYTDRQGMFAIERIPEDLWLILRIDSPLVEKTLIEGMEKWSPEDREHLVLRLGPGGVVHGRINREVIKGEGRVGLANNELQFSIDLLKDEDSYRFTGVPAGTYSLHWNQDRHTEKEIAVDKDGVVEADLGFEETYRIAGHAVYADGGPVAGKLIYLRTTTAKPSDNYRIKNARTDARGNFVFESLVPGEYRLELLGHVSPGDFYAPYPGPYPNGSDLTVLTRDMEIEVTFERYGTIRGRLVGKENIAVNLTLEWNVVDLRSNAPTVFQRHIRNKGLGNFEFDMVQPGQGRLKLSFEGGSNRPFHVVEPIIHAADGTDTDLGEIFLEQPGSLGVSLTGLTRGIPPRQFLSVTPVDTSTLNRFNERVSLPITRIPNMVPNAYHASFSLGPEWRLTPRIARFTIVGGEETQIEMHCEPTTFLEWFPDNRSSVTLLNESLGLEYRAQFQQNPEKPEAIPISRPFAFQTVNGGLAGNLPQGDWEFLAVFPDGRNHRKTVTLKKGVTVLLDVSDLTQN